MYFYLLGAVNFLKELVSMSVIKKVIIISDLRLCDLDDVVYQVAEYLVHVYYTCDINDLSFCIALDDNASLNVLIGEDDLETYDLFDPENLLDDAEYFTIRELIESVYSVVKLKKDLSDIVLYKDVEDDLLFLF